MLQYIGSHMLQCMLMEMSSYGVHNHMELENRIETSGINCFNILKVYIQN